MSEAQVKTRYLNLFVDYAFKRMFGTEHSKPYLIDLLNAILQLKDKIIDLSFLDKEQLGITAADRKAVFDVFCIDQSGRRFIIELQNLFQPRFRDRSLYYSTFPIQVQAVKGDWDFELQETITIGILGFKFDHTHPDQLIHRVRLIEEESGIVFNDHLAYVYIETPKFKKKEEDLESRLDHWLYVLRGMPTFKEIPVTLREDELFKSFFMAAEVANLEFAEYMNYVASQKEQWDRYAIKKGAIEEGMKEGIEQGIEQGMQQGIEQGREEGIEKGREEGILTVARAMKAKGLDVNIIQETTGLSAEEIDQL